VSSPGFRRFKDRLFYFIGAICVLIAMIPLASILYEVVKNGAAALSVEFLTSPPGVIGQPGGGIANAIQGTILLIILTSAIGVPLGVFSGVYLAEFGNTRLGGSIRFLNNVLSGFPSIVVGLVVYTLIVLATGKFSLVAGALALSIIMLPVVTRTTEESMRLVPSSIRDAAMALGIRRWRTTLSVVLTTARPGVVTGILLSIARISGETAPLLLTILGSQFFFSGIDQPVDALPLRIYRLSSLPYQYAVQQGWGAALVLILIVLTLNVGVRIVTGGKYATQRTRI
jgi:phosphate transport system permease protein